MLVRVTVLLLTFAIAPILMAGSNTKLCTCETPTVCQAFSRAVAVFSGKLVSVTVDEAESVETIHAKFEVQASYKGGASHLETVVFRIGSCDRDLKVGEIYFVYKEIPIRSDLVCNRTLKLQDAGEDVKYAKSISQESPIFTVSGLITGVSVLERGKIRIKVLNGRDEIKVPLDGDGKYTYVATKGSEINVRIIFPNEEELNIHTLGQDFFKRGTEVEYKLQFRPNECDFRSIDVSR